MPSNALRAPRKKRRQPLDLDLVKTQYRRIAQGEYPALRTIADVARHFNTSARELHRLLGPHTKELSRTLAVRRSKAASQRREAKKRILEAEVPRAVHRLLTQSKHPTRRAIKRELATSGVTVDRGNDKLMWQLVRKALLETHVELSGSS
ncbi:hypothetical protein GJQ57_24290 [Ralstonia pickettii]|uniref:Uncharacterized protein n=1 Tax=Ralstonia pickettii TaxID=329 RepID=A0A7X2HSA8_RALPI|nr:hypothetical protein [Ralstonia pickettii]MRT01772.1 hypothetical protein [Ralstonia pickettii]